MFDSCIHSISAVRVWISVQEDHESTWSPTFPMYVRMVIVLSSLDHCAINQFGYNLPMPLLLVLAPLNFDLPSPLQLSKLPMQLGIIAGAIVLAILLPSPLRMGISSKTIVFLYIGLKVDLVVAPTATVSHSPLCIVVILIVHDVTPPSIVALLTNVDTTCFCPSSWSLLHWSLTCHPYCDDQNCRCRWVSSPVPSFLPSYSRLPCGWALAQKTIALLDIGLKVVFVFARTTTISHSPLRIVVFLIIHEVSPSLHYFPINHFGYDLPLPLLGVLAPSIFYLPSPLQWSHLLLQLGMIAGAIILAVVLLSPLQMGICSKDN